MKDNKKVNAELVEFWNSAIKLPEDYKEEVRKSSDNSVMDLVPAQKLFDAVLRRRFTSPQNRALFYRPRYIAARLVLHSWPTEP